MKNQGQVAASQVSPQGDSASGKCLVRNCHQEKAQLHAEPPVRQGVAPLTHLRVLQRENESGAVAPGAACRRQRTRGHLETFVL